MRINLLTATAVLTLLAVPVFAQTTPAVTAPTTQQSAQPAATPQANAPAASTTESATTTAPAASTAMKTTGHKATAAQRRAVRCDVLTHQFGDAATKHGGAKSIVPAKALADQGESECHAGKTVSGIRNLERALKDLGEKPKV
ncbi:MAG: hypothetical protein P4M00_23190 [Azospirillaceae bacterium]|nr:hypothetical protein [Azospirillaceae bacterium]